MGDRLANGFFAGIVAFVITTPLNLALVHLNLIDQGFPDFAGAMSLGRFPETLSELIFGTIVEGMTSGAWGIIFAFFIRVIGNKYLLFKGWIYAGAAWYLYVLVLFFLITDFYLAVQTAVLNGIMAGLWGIIMAKAYDWLHTRDEPIVHTAKRKRGDLRKRTRE